MMGNELIRYFTTNRVVRNFIFADLALFGGWGLVSPIMAVFVVENIPGATLITVGTMAGIYWAVRSAVQLPMATIMERTVTEKDDLYILIVGLLLVSVSAFWLNFVKTIPQLYAFQAVHALGFGFYGAAWAGIFSRHIDRSKAAFSWSLDHTFLGVATGITGLTGGYIAQQFGFGAIFTMAGILSFVSAVLIFLVPDIIIPGKKKKSAPVMNHSPKTISR